jgi:hypothetical protein
MSWGDPVDLKDDGQGGISASIRERPINFLIPLAGVTNAGNAATGVIGEVVSASVAAATTGLTTATPANVTSVTLSPGDWDVDSSIVISGAASTSFTASQSGVNTTSATLPATNLQNLRSSGAFVPPSAIYVCAALPKQRFNVAVSTTVYLVVNATFTISTAGAGGTIIARRVR